MLHPPSKFVVVILFEIYPKHLPIKRTFKDSYTMVAIAIVVAFYKVSAIVAAFSEYCTLHSVHCQILLTCLLDSCPPCVVTLSRASTWPPVP